MEILTLKIREDLRKHNQVMRAQWTARWRWLQLLVLICGLLVAVFSLLPQRWPVQQAVYLLLFAPLLLLTGIQPFVNAAGRRFLITALLAFVYVVLALASAVLNPVEPAAVGLLPRGAIWISLLIPILSWSILLRLFHIFPSQARQYSLRGKPVLINLLIGAGVGLAAVLHLYMVSYFIPSMEYPAGQFSREGLIWGACVLAGLIVPAEELLFRGAAFSILYDELNVHFPGAVARVTVLNVLVHLVIIVSSHSVQPFALLTLVYRAGLSAACLYLVLRRRSLLPCMLANLIFSMATGWLFVL